MVHIRLEVEVLFDEHLGDEKELQAVEGEDRAHRLHEELLRDLAAAQLEGLDAGAGSAMRDVASFDAGATFAAAPAARSMESVMRVRVID